MPRTSRAWPPRLGLAALVLVQAACGGGEGPVPTGVPSRASAAPVLPTGTGPADPSSGGPGSPDGLQGTLLQFRRDVPVRRLQVRLTADVGGLVVEDLDVEAAGVAAAPTSFREAALRPGTPVDLPVLAGPSDCTVEPGRPSARVRLRDGAGGRREVTVPLDDRGLVGRLHETDCAQQALRAQADIALTAVRQVDTADGPALDVVVRLSRVGGRSPVRVTGIGSNTVYSITAQDSLPTLGDEESVDLELRLLPARCDVHALGESYRTGLIGLVLAVGDDVPRPHVMTPEAAVRSRLESFAVETCRARSD